MTFMSMINGCSLLASFKKKMSMKKNKSKSLSTQGKSYCLPNANKRLANILGAELILSISKNRPTQ
jgi:hypothetical protein